MEHVAQFLDLICCGMQSQRSQMCGLARLCRHLIGWSTEVEDEFVSLVLCVSKNQRSILVLQHSRKGVYETLAYNYLGSFAILMGT